MLERLKGAKLIAAAGAISLLVLVGVLLWARSGSQTADKTAPGAAPGDLHVTRLSSEKLERVWTYLESANKEVPADTLDPHVIVQKVGEDPQMLLRWVRTNTKWVPYRGLLRGSSGVLMDRIGNSLDRSLLLAELMTAAGATVRLANRSLSRTESEKLLDSVVQSREQTASPDQATSGGSTEESEFARVARESGLPEQELRAAVRNMTERGEQLRNAAKLRIDTQTRFLGTSIGKSNGQEDWRARAIEAIEDHWWVQQQVGSDWIDLDPARRPEDSSPSSPARQTFDLSDQAALGTVPAHEVLIRVVVARTAQGHVTEETVLTHSLRAADVAGRLITLEMVPLGGASSSELIKGGLAALRSAVVQQAEWFPTLIVGDKVTRQFSFRDNGEINRTPGSGPDRSSSGGLDPLSGGEPEDRPASELKAVRVEFETRIPGRPTRITGRKLYVRIPTGSHGDSNPLGADERFTRALALLGTTQVLIQSSRLSAEYAVSQSIKGLLANRPVMSAAASGTPIDVGGSAGPKVEPTAGRLLDLAVARFAWNELSDVVYLESPNVLTFRVSLTPDAAGRLVVREGYDIVTNEIAVHREWSESAFQERMRQGVADTNAESLLVPGDTSNAGASLGSDPAAAGSWTVVRGLKDESWSAASWPARLRSELQTSLEAGNAVIVPRVVAAPSERWVWWRIDPKTGTTLGMGVTGGQSLTERVLVGGGVGSLGFWGAWAICQASKPGPLTPVEEQKCMCQGVGAGIGIGGYVTTYAIKGQVGAFLGPLGFLVAAAVASAFCALL